MRNNWIRFVAGALVSVVLVGVFALTGGMKSGKSTEGLLYQASGLHPDGEMLVVSGQTVTCEEYLRWVDYACQYISSRIPDVDWNEQVSEDGMTYGEYVKVEAVETVKQYAVIRAWAQQENVTLSDADKAQLAAQRQQYVDYYGSEEAYLQQLALVGISDEGNNATLEVQYLYRDLYQSFCTPGSSLYPDDKTLSDYADQQGYVSLYVLKLNGENAETMAADILERWQAAEDKEAEYALLCDELQLTADGIVTLASAEGDALSDAMTALEVGEMASVIDPYGDGSCFVMLRTDTDLAAVAETYFDTLFEQKLEAASVVTNSKLYDSLDVGAFFEKLTQLRTEMMEAMQSTDTPTGTADDTADDAAGTTGDTGGTTETAPAE